MWRKVALGTALKNDAQRAHNRHATNKQARKTKHLEKRWKRIHPHQDFFFHFTKFPDQSRKSTPKIVFIPRSFFFFFLFLCVMFALFLDLLSAETKFGIVVGIVAIFLIGKVLLLRGTNIGPLPNVSVPKGMSFLLRSRLCSGFLGLVAFEEVPDSSFYNFSSPCQRHQPQAPVPALPVTLLSTMPQLS